MNDRNELTIPELRQFPGYENVSDGEAKEIIRDLKTLSIMLYKLYQKKLILDDSDFSSEDFF